MDYPVQIVDQLAQQLPALRKARGLSQSDLGLKLGISQSRIAYIEANPAAISVKQLCDILQTIGVQMVLRTDLLPGKPAPQRPPSAPTRAKGEW